MERRERSRREKSWDSRDSGCWRAEKRHIQRKDVPRKVEHKTGSQWEWPGGGGRGGGTPGKRPRPR